MTRIDYDLNDDDYMAYVHYHFRHSDDAKAGRRRMAIFGTMAFAIYAYGTKDDPHYGLHAPLLFAARLALTVAAFGGFLFVYFRVARPMLMRGMTRNSRLRQTLGKTRLELKDDAAQVTNTSGKGRLAWEACRGVVDDTNHLYLILGPMRAFIVPKRAFATPEEASAFFETAFDRYRAAKR